MLPRFLFVLYSLVLFLPQISMADESQVNGLKTGLYYGYSVVSDRQEKMPVLLFIEKDSAENIGESSEDQVNPLIAYFKVQLGGFKSNEYMTYPYYVME